MPWRFPDVPIAHVDGSLSRVRETRTLSEASYFLRVGSYSSEPTWRGVRSIETGCDAIDRAGLHRGVTGGDHGDDHVRLNAGCFTLDGARGTRFYERFVRAPRD